MAIMVPGEIEREHAVSLFDNGTAVVFGFNNARAYTDINTSSDAASAYGTLQSLGYDSTLMFDAEPQDAYACLPGSTIFYFTGHGSSGYIKFADGYFLGAKRGNGGYYWAPCYISDLHDGSLSGTKLIVLNSCSGATGNESTGNMLDMLVSKGAGTAIGFRHDIGESQGNYWGKMFFKHMSRGCTADEASRNACKDVYLRFIGFTGNVTEQNIVIKGDSGLKIAG